MKKIRSDHKAFKLDEVKEALQGLMQGITVIGPKASGRQYRVIPSSIGAPVCRRFSAESEDPSSCCATQSAPPWKPFARLPRPDASATADFCLNIEEVVRIPHRRTGTDAI